MPSRFHIMAIDEMNKLLSLELAYHQRACALTFALPESLNIIYTLMTTSLLPADGVVASGLARDSKSESVHECAADASNFTPADFKSWAQQPRARKMRRFHQRRPFVGFPLR